MPPLKHWNWRSLSANLARNEPPCGGVWYPARSSWRSRLAFSSAGHVLHRQGIAQARSEINWRTFPIVNQCLEYGRGEILLYNKPERSEVVSNEKGAL